MLMTGIARIGKDAVLRFTPSGQKVANLTLAYHYGQKGADGKRPTQWIDAALWGDRAESLAPHLLKGTAVSITLSDPHQESYTTRDGKQGTKIVGRVIDLEFAGVAKAGNGAPSAPATQPAPTATPAGAAGGLGDFDDDMPF